MIAEEQAETSVDLRVARPPAGSRAARAGSCVMDYRGHHILMHTVASPTARLTPLARRVWAAATRRRNVSGICGSICNADEVLLSATRDAAVAGRIMIRMDSPAGLRVEARHAPVVDALRQEGRSVCELDLLAFDQGPGAVQIMRVLLDVALLYAVAVRGASDMLLEVPSLQVEIYRRSFGFRRAREVGPNARASACGVLLHRDLREIPRNDLPAANGLAFDGHPQDDLVRRMRAALSTRRTPAPHPVLSAERRCPESDDAPVAIAPAQAGALRVTAPDAEAFDEGLRAGTQARLRNDPLSPYQRVGLDGFSRGFRAGYFASRMALRDASEGRAAV